jgi:hypothetical protein
MTMESRVLSILLLNLQFCQIYIIEISKITESGYSKVHVVNPSVNCEVLSGSIFYQDKQLNRDICIYQNQLP